jgi:cytochrome c
MILSTKNRYIIIFLLLMFGLMGQNVSAASIKVITQDQPAKTCYKGGVEDVVDLVDKAVALMNKKGIFPAFRQIMDPAGGFIKGELYVFVINKKGTIVANGAAPGSVGSNTLLSRDQNGRYFIQEILQQAFANGKGWTKYHWFSPCTGKMAEKVVYFKRAGAFVVGAGFYNNLGI